MRNLRWPLLAICLVAFCVVNPLQGLAQPGDPGNPDVPVTGIEILIGLGGLFGFKKLINNRNQKQN